MEKESQSVWQKIKVWLKESEDGFGDKVCETDEIDYKMPQHYSREGTCSYKQHHKDRTGDGCYNYLMQASSPVDKSKCGSRYNDDDKGVSGISGEKHKGVAPENEFFKKSDKQKAKREINPDP